MEVLAIALAGGKERNSIPLTRDRAKPAVPFGGKYRIIDFVLSNLVNSGIYSIFENSIILNWVEIGRPCRIRRAIIDKNNVIPPGTEISADPAKDRERYFVSETGIVVLPRAQSQMGRTFTAS